ncbi:MAG: ester cyclase [Cyclobacteriaceae bacterium]|jgi:hypothetical protein|nr:ester cyclase [Cyclobacteriaceae bacterium]
MKKYIILMALVAGLFAACTPNNSKKQAENVDVVKSYVTAVENLDFESMDKLLDDKYMGLGPSYGDTIYKDQAIENWKYYVENLYEKIEYTRKQFAPVTIAEGDAKGEWVANWSEMHIVFKDGAGEVTLWANTNYMIENGKIVRSLTLYNEADALRQLGYQMVSVEE